MEPKILVVDDPDSWHSLSTILRTHQFHPIWAADTSQAMREASKYQAQAILLDLDLPGFEGFLLLERLKTNRVLASVPVFVMSAEWPEQAEETAQELGAVPFSTNL